MDETGNIWKKEEDNLARERTNNFLIDWAYDVRKGHWGFSEGANWSVEGAERPSGGWVWDGGWAPDSRDFGDFWYQKQLF